MKPPAELLNIACPPQSELVELSVGKLDESRIATVARHVGHCPRCQEFIQTYHDTSDSVVGLVRGDSMPAFEPGEVSQVRNELLARGPQPDPAGDGAELRPFPRKFGHYEVGEFIGQGGMGTVYSARHLKLQRSIVIKFLSPRRLGDADSIARFHREMAVVGRFADPHIIFAHDAGEIDGHLFIVMEAVDGLDLRRLLFDGGPLPAREACELARQAAAGLSAAHKLNVVHRDVKPSNLLVSTSGQVKVLDLGLATLMSECRPGDRSGTADYMAPEQWTGSAVDARTDVYGLGCTLFKLLTGKAPFHVESANAADRMQAHLETAVPHLDEFREDLPDGLDELVQRMLAKSPTERFASMAEVEEALRPFAAESSLPELVRGRRAAGIQTESDLHRSTFINVQEPIAAPLPRGPRVRRPWLVGLALLPLLALALFLAIPRRDADSPVQRTELLTGRVGAARLINHDDVFGGPRLESHPDGGVVATATNMGGWVFGQHPDGPYGLQLEFTPSQFSNLTGILADIGATPGQFNSWQFQGISLLPTQDERELNVIWHQGELERNHGDNTSSAALATVPMPPPGKVELGLLMAPGKPIRMFWNGREVPQREDFKVFGPMPNSPLGGSFGLMQGIGTTRFHRFTLLQGDEEKLYAALNYNARGPSGL